MQAFLQKFLFLLFLPLLLFCHSGGAAPVSTENGTEILVLNYHKIDRANHPLAVPPEEFEAQILHLKNNNYHSISPDELYDYLAFQKPLPYRPVLITFDDGYEDNYLAAYPILKKHGFRATIFVIPSLMGKKNYLTWQQAREMSKNGISIQSHTVSHKPLSDLSREEAEKELAESRRIIQENVGQPVSYIAYPEGSYNRLIEQLAEKAGYKAGFSIRYGSVDRTSDRLALERIPIFRTDRTFRDFLRRIHYASSFERVGWVTP